MNKVSLLLFTMNTVTGMVSAGALPEDAAGNEFLHDLVGATVDGLHLGVHIGTADGVLGHVATPAKQLHTVRCHTVLQVGQPVCGQKICWLVRLRGCCTLFCVWHISKVYNHSVSALMTD